MFNIFSIFFDKLPSRRNLIPHSHGKGFIRSCYIIKGYLNQTSVSEVHCCIPKLLGIHFSKTLVPLYFKLSLAFSTFNILPLSGRIACLFLSLPILALPPAESPSTRNISDRTGSFSEQSASLPGSAIPSSTPFLLVNSLAFLAASLALAALKHLSRIILACAGFSSRKPVKCSFVEVSTNPLTSLFPSFVFV